MPPDDLDDAAAANPVASPSSTTNYLVFAIDTNGCAGTDQMWVNVNPPMDNGGGEKTKHRDLEVKVWPNPATEVLNINITNVGQQGFETNDATTTISLVDVLGRKIYVHRGMLPEISNLAIDVSHLINGQYILRINSQDKMTTRLVTLSK